MLRDCYEQTLQNILTEIQYSCMSSWNLLGWFFFFSVCSIDEQEQRFFNWTVKTTRCYRKVPRSYKVLENFG